MKSDQVGRFFCFFLGIGTVTPTAKLDVQGNARIAIMENASATSKPVYWNQTTKTLEAFNGTVKPFTTYKYTISLKDSDWISDLNLNISTTDYTVIVTSAQFRLLNDAQSSSKAMGGVSLNNQSINTVSSAFNDAGSAKTELGKLTVADKGVHTFQKDGTWRIYADYKDAALVSKTTYEWVFDILVINNSMVKVGTAQTGAIISGGSLNIPKPSDL